MKPRAIALWIAALSACGDEPVPVGGEPPPPVCEPGSTRACFDGPEEREGVGACRAGVQVCAPHGRGWGACEEQVLPRTEVCGDAVDDDCDGLTSCGETVWSHRYGSDADDYLVRAATDAGGDLVVTGSYRNPFVLGTSLSTTNGSRDVLLSRLDPQGAARWSVGVYGNSNFIPRDVAVAPDGRIAMVASTAGSVLIDGGPQHAGGGSMDVLLLMVTPDGQHLRSAVWGDGEAQNAAAIAFAPDGDLILGGFFLGTLDLGGGEPLTAGGDADVFVARFDPDGELRFARAFAGAGADTLRELAVGADGSVHLAGHFEGEIDLGTGVLVDRGGGDAFAAVLGPTGETRWAASWGGEQSDQALAVAVDAAGHTVLAGRFEGAFPFPVADGHEAPAAAGGNLFVTRLDPDGAVTWSRTLAGAANAAATDVAIDGRGRVVVTGFYEGQPAWADRSLPESGVREPNILVAKLDSDGTPVWARGMRVRGEQDSSGVDRGWRGVAIAPDDRIVLVGLVGGLLDLGQGPLTPLGGTDLLVALLEP